MIILLRFNFHDQITFEGFYLFYASLLQSDTQPQLLLLEITAETQIPERDLKRSLQSLAMSRPTQQVLLRQGNGQEIGTILGFFCFKFKFQI